MKRHLTTFGVVAILLVASVGPADAHYFIGGDSVDSGEIAYQDNTSYNTELAHANSTWNALNPINVIPDDPWRIQDLRWNTVNRCDVTWAGQWRESAASDDIDLNTCTFNRAGNEYTAFQRNGTAAHELGHALGLGHNTEGDTASTDATLSILKAFLTSDTDTTLPVQDYFGTQTEVVPESAPLPAGNTQLMYRCSRCTGKNTPQTHDKQDYHELWGY